MSTGLQLASLPRVATGTIRTRDPLHASTAGCAVMGSTDGGYTAPEPCEQEPAAGAVVTYPYDGSTWRVFLCVDHTDAVTGAEPLTKQDRAELTDRQSRVAQALSGGSWMPPEPISRRTPARHHRNR